MDITGEHPPNDALYTNKFITNHNANHNIQCANTQPFSAGQYRYPFGVSGTSSVNQKGINFSQFTDVSNKDDQFDPYVQYIYKKGMFGQTQHRYFTNYLHIDSQFQQSDRRFESTREIQLQQDPFLFVGNKLRILMNDTSNINIGDDILIGGLCEKKITLRNKLPDGECVIFQKQSQYLAIGADNNIDVSMIDTLNPPTSPQFYATFNGFVGDDETTTTYDLSDFIISCTFDIEKTIYLLTICEDLRAMGKETNELATTLICSCVINLDGNVVECDMVNKEKNHPHCIPDSYPMRFENFFDSFENWQKKVRPIFSETQLDFKKKTCTKKLTTIGNIPINFLNQTHRILLAGNDNACTSCDKFFVELMKKYDQHTFELTNSTGSHFLTCKRRDTPVYNIDIAFLHYGGIAVSDICARSCKRIIGIELNKHIEIQLDRYGLYKTPFGGKCAYIDIVSNMNNNTSKNNGSRYNIALEQNYTNIVMVRMTNSIFPKTQMLFYDGTNDKKNNALYWQNLYDGEHVHKIEIDSGNYTADELKKAIENKTNGAMIIDINEKTNNVTFYNYAKKKYLGNIKLFAYCARMDKINNIDFPEYANQENEFYKNMICNFETTYRVKIYHPNHDATVDQHIIINGSENFGEISPTSINKEHRIARIIDGDNYDIIIDAIGDTTNVNAYDHTNMGGNNIVLQFQTLFRLRMDFNDTMGNELGFRDVGTEKAVTPYKCVINNNNLYNNEHYGDALIHNPVVLKPPSYLLILCKELQNVDNLHGNIKHFFYKINLPVEHGENAFDTFVDAPIFFPESLKRLSTLSFEFVTPTGELYDFHKKHHSFTLEIITHNEIPDRTCIKDNL